ncbi:hypothetical protein HYW17_05615 [Candidatus Uhrbacteria bacterium]|nr:hypothetical protein [Candidatus Uhrbacteria bacterium]
MKQKIILGLTTLVLAVAPAAADAHGADRALGQQLAEDLRAGAAQCAMLDDEKFESMGDYYMEQMLGEAHESMDALMEKMMGEGSEAQMHTAMGKRMSGCDGSAPMPAGMMSGMMNMMTMMGSGGGMMSGSGMMGSRSALSGLGTMMGGSYSAGFSTLWSVVGILAAVALALVIAKYLKELFK